MKSFLDTLLGSVELPLTIANGAVAQPLSGLWGLLNGGDADAVRKAEETLNWKPKTESAKSALNMIASLLAPIGEVAKKVPDYVFDKTGSPTLAAAIQSIPGVLLAASPVRFSAQSFWD